MFNDLDSFSNFVSENISKQENNNKKIKNGIKQILNIDDEQLKELNSESRFEMGNILSDVWIAIKNHKLGELGYQFIKKIKNISDNFSKNVFLIGLASKPVQKNDFLKLEPFRNRIIEELKPFYAINKIPVIDQISPDKLEIGKTYIIEIINVYDNIHIKFKFRGDYVKNNKNDINKIKENIKNYLREERNDRVFNTIPIDNYTDEKYPLANLNFQEIIDDLRELNYDVDNEHNNDFDYYHIESLNELNNIYYLFKNVSLINKTAIDNRIKTNNYPSFSIFEENLNNYMLPIKNTFAWFKFNKYSKSSIYLLEKFNNIYNKLYENSDLTDMNRYIGEYIGEATPIPSLKPKGGKKTKHYKRIKNKKHKKTRKKTKTKSRRHRRR